MPTRFSLALVSAWLLAACAQDPAAPEPVAPLAPTAAPTAPTPASVPDPGIAPVPAPPAGLAPTSRPYARWPDVLETMPQGPQQIARVCERAGADLVRDVFCSGPAPSFTSLVELQLALKVGANDVRGFGEVSPTGGLAALAVTGHSTALSARSVSAINPRVIAVRISVVPLELLALAFTRGEQFVELVVRDRLDGGLRFYVAGFRQACNARPQGCTPGDLLTPAIERGWSTLSLYDEEDLKNTVLDCATCHQPDGPGTPKLLRMQELDDPWTHWFWKDSEGGRALLADYAAAKGDEPLAGMTAAHIDNAHPSVLSTLVVLTNPTQPNEFEAATIEAETRASAAALGGMQPHDNTIPGQSPTWRIAYESALRGEAISVPYHDVKVTDPAKLAYLTAAYQAYRRGELDSSQLPDLRDVYPDDPRQLADLGVMTEPGLTGEGVLVQACAQCHNPRLNPTLSRARFRADLQGMSREEKDLAITRLLLPEEDPLAMPPARFRVLDSEARNRAIAALQR